MLKKLRYFVKYVFFIFFDISMMIGSLIYRFISLLVLVSLLPSLIGVHVFEHYCSGCDKSDTVTTLITTVHDHHSSCSSCSYDEVCHSYSHETGRHIHHEADDDCKHHFEIVNYDGQTVLAPFNFKATNFDLLYSTCLLNNFLSVNTNLRKGFVNVIQNIPDEPSSEMNCVFLL